MPKEHPMTTGEFGVEENVLFNTYDLKRLGDHENTPKYVEWVDLITFGSKINVPIHNQS
jgi:hypothetical protein